jgi:hypothetical protein
MIKLKYLPTLSPITLKKKTCHVGRWLGHFDYTASDSYVIYHQKTLEYDEIEVKFSKDIVTVLFKFLP